MLGGRLPLPEALWSKQRDRAARLLASRLPALQRSARIEPDGATNESAIGAAMCELVLQVLNGQPAEPILFLPRLDEGRGIPVKLTAVSIENQTLGITVEPLGASERAGVPSAVTGALPRGADLGSTFAELRQQDQLV